MEQTVLDDAFHIDSDGSDSLDTRDYRTGYYRITLKAKDPGGEDLLVKRYFTVYDRKSKSLPYASTSTLMPVKTNCEPGEKAEVVFGSSYKPAHVLMRLEHRGKILREQWVKLSAAQRSFSVPIEEKHRGGVTLHLFFVHSYRTYSERIFIAVPWSNKQLTIETATFRDKLRPGQKEEWRLTIKGEKADQVAAEMVAGMYDASLDAIYRQSWPSFAWPSFNTWSRISGQTFGMASAKLHQRDWNRSPGHWHQQYDRLNMFLLDVGYGHYYGRGQGIMKSGRMRMDSEMSMNAPMAAMAADGLSMVAEEGEMLDESKKEGWGGKDKNDMDDGKAQGAGEDLSMDGLDNLKVRSNFNETAFFFPQLMTNDSGEVVLSFTVPEALTRWKLRTFAHTPELDIGYLERTAVTQKELMVMPNVPRFLREGDRIVLSAKITNLSDSALSGVAALKLFDAVTMKPLDSRFGLKNASKPFTTEQGRSTVVRWDLTVPDGLSAIVYRFVAKAGAFSDGEEAPLPVLPNRMLVTESLPLNVRGNTERSYSFTRLANAGNSSTLRHHRLTLEMTSNPAWYAIQALPYLMEYPYECSEQVFNRLYANSIAAHIVGSSPKIKRVFEQWKGTDALLSNLEKNQELKSLLLEETPWVMQAQNETQRKQRVGLLFDLNNMANSLDRAIRKLEKKQSSNGGWPWFPGMPESRYITQYIVAGFGHLRELGVRDPDQRITRMLERAVRFIDERMAHDYEELKRREDPIDPEKDYLRHIDLQYLYARSYFLKQEIPEQHREAVDFWLDQSRRFWLRRNLMSQGMIALSTYRYSQSAYNFDNKKLPGKIVASLRERSLNSDELGMYWKQERGWYWYQAPIQTQALLIEAFDVIDGDMHSVEEMKIWLLKQKQVQDWKTTIATAEACYALLRRGSDLLASDEMVEVRMGGNVIDPAAMGADIEAGTGHYKVAWSGSEISSDMAEIELTKKDKGIAWGAVYWQYFEKLENITAHDTPLSIEKKLYRQVNTDKGVTLEPITEKNPLKVGDILKVRITIRVDRNMEYVHMKDMRGAGLELINQLSVHRWQGGLGYYEAPKDASVNFFFQLAAQGRACIRVRTARCS